MLVLPDTISKPANQLIHTGLVNIGSAWIRIARIIPNTHAGTPRRFLKIAEIISPPFHPISGRNNTGMRSPDEK
jgi:hypothetical protein